MAERTATAVEIDVAPLQVGRRKTGISARRNLQLRQRLLPWLGPLALLAMWQVAAEFGGLSPHILPAPTRVASAAIKLLRTGELVADLEISLLRAAIGFAIGGMVGFSLGLLVGFSRVAETLLDRTVQMLRAIPFLAALPLVIVWLGIGEGAKIFLVALGVSFPLYIITALGIRPVDPMLLE